MDEDATGMEVWLGLIEKTREALATLRLEELEALAEQAERLFNSTYSSGLDLDRGMPAKKDSLQMRLLVSQHKKLGDLLDATDQNLAVLRRLNGQEVNSRWQH